jgi:hypothetical protein
MSAEREGLRDIVANELREWRKPSDIFRRPINEAAARIIALLDTDRDDCPTCRRLIEAMMAEMEGDDHE